VDLNVTTPGKLARENATTVGGKAGTVVTGRRVATAGAAYSASVIASTVRMPLKVTELVDATVRRDATGGASGAAP